MISAMPGAAEIEPALHPIQTATGGAASPEGPPFPARRRPGHGPVAPGQEPGLSRQLVKKTGESSVSVTPTACGDAERRPVASDVALLEGGGYRLEAKMVQRAEDVGPGQPGAARG
jgi:hypothetical protein